MKVHIKENLHYAHSRALLAQLASDTVEVLEQYGLFTRDQNRDLAKDLLFRVCAVLDGSAHAGTLNGETIAPFVGFYLAHETEDVLIPKDGSGMHAEVGQVIDEHYSRGSGGA